MKLQEKNIFECESGQQAVEYMLLFVAVVMVMVIAVASRGVFTETLDRSLDKSVVALEGYSEGRVCFDGQVQEAWDGNGCCPSGCCILPIPNNFGENECN